MASMLLRIHTKHSPVWALTMLILADFYEKYLYTTVAKDGKANVG